LSIGCSVEFVVSSVTTKGQQNLLLGLSLAVVDILLELRALSVEEVVVRVVDAVVTRTCIVSIPTLVAEVLRNQSVRKVREDIDETNGDDIDSGRITEMGQTLLIWSLSLIHHQYKSKLSFERFPYIVHRHVRLRKWVVIGRD